MRGLFINTCLSQIEVALVEDSEVIASESWTQSRSESSLLQPSIIKLLGEAGWKLEDIEKVFLVVGPGSFTAIRVGVIVGKAIAEKLEIEVGVMTTFDYLAKCIGDEGFMFLNAGGNSAYRFGNGNDMTIVDLEKYSLELSSNFLFLNEKQRKKYNVENTTIESIDNCWKLVMENFDTVLVKDVSGIVPHYVKEPNIT